MNEKLLVNLRLHARALYKYRWRGLFVAWVLAVVGAGVVLKIPKKYEASVRVYANTDSILKPLLAGITVQPDNNQRVAMLSRIVISRPNVQRLIEATGLDATVHTSDERERLIDDTIKVLDLQRAGDINSNVYVVKFRDTQPARALHVVEMLVSMFIETNAGGRDTDTATAKTFLDQQAALYEKKLQDAENHVKDFKLRNMMGMTAEDKDYLTQMATVSDQLRTAQLQLREAETSRDAYQRGLASEDAINNAQAATTSTVGPDRLIDIDARIDTMRRNLDNLLLRYTDNHPDVLGARRVIHDLEAQRSRMVTDMRAAGVPLTSAPPVTGPRASEQLRVSLAQAEANVASLRARVAEYSARYQQMQARAQRMPELEAELAQLTRDYEVEKKNYENLIARRESANISGDMQSVTGVGDFRVVDPPRVSPTAVFPNRPVLMVATLVFALVCGFGTLYVSNELRPCIYDRAQLREATGLPVLGIVSLIDDEKKQRVRHQDQRKFALSAAGLSAVYVVFVIIMVVLTGVTS